MLSRADYGLYVCGRVDTVSEINHREGKTEKGKEYSFWQQSVTLTIGGKMIEVIYRADSNPAAPLVTAELDEIVRIAVKNPRIFNGTVSFDAA